MIDHDDPDDPYDHDDHDDPDDPDDPNDQLLLLPLLPSLPSLPLLQLLPLLTLLPFLVSFCRSVHPEFLRSLSKSPSSLLLITQLFRRWMVSKLGWRGLKCSWRGPRTLQDHTKAPPRPTVRDLARPYQDLLLRPTTKDIPRPSKGPHLGKLVYISLRFQRATVFTFFLRNIPKKVRKTKNKAFRSTYLERMPIFSI